MPSQEEKCLIRRQKEFVRWLKEKGIYNNMASAGTMVELQQVWEESRKEITARDGVIQSLSDLVRRAVKDIGYHTDYHEGSVKYYNHEVLASQADHVNRCFTEQWVIAKGLGVEIRS